MPKPRSDRPRKGPSIEEKKTMPDQVCSYEYNIPCRGVVFPKPQGLESGLVTYLTQSLQEFKLLNILLD